MHTEIILVMFINLELNIPRIISYNLCGFFAILANFWPFFTVLYIDWNVVNSPVAFTEEFVVAIYWTLVTFYPSYSGHYETSYGKTNTGINAKVWYFVSKIVLTFCEKKLFLWFWDHENNLFKQCRNNFWMPSYRGTEVGRAPLIHFQKMFFQKGFL